MQWPIYPGNRTKPATHYLFIIDIASLDAQIGHHTLLIQKSIPIKQWSPAMLTTGRILKRAYGVGAIRKFQWEHLGFRKS